MAIKYLNKRQKDMALTLAAFTAYLDDRAVELTERSPQLKAQIKYLKTAKTFTQKVLDDMFTDVDRQQVRVLLGETDPRTGVKIKKGELERMEVVVKYKDEAVREYKAMEKLDENVTLPTDDFIGLLSFSMASCNLCDLCGSDVQKCDIRKIYVEHGAEVLTPEPGDGCPYRLQEGSELFKQYQEAVRNAEA